MPELLIDYGDTKMRVAVPSSALVVRPGDTFIDPPAVDPCAAIRSALERPLGLPPLRDVVKRGDRVVVAFPDRVKGGTHPQSHRRVAIPIVYEELKRGGVRHEDFQLICAAGLHRKNTEQEFREYLGDEIVNEFWPDRLACHDAEDPDGIISFGLDPLGGVVEFNRRAAEADHLILIGHVAGNPYGGYSGGYKMPATGLTTWRSIRSHHTLESLHRPDFVPANAQSHFRHQLCSVGQAIERGIGKQFFELDAVIGSESQVLGVYGGAPALVEHESWKLADRRTSVCLGRKVDVLVVGLPRSFHYGPGMGTNPILMLQAIGAIVVRCWGAMNPGAVVIAASICDGWFNDEWFPAYREVFELLQRMKTSAELAQFEDEISVRPLYVSKYRHHFAYHPFHAFSMVYLGDLALKYTGAVVIAGAQKPELAEAMGCIPAENFSEALQLAQKRVGKNPQILVLQDFFTRVPVHLYGAEQLSFEGNK